MFPALFLCVLLVFASGCRNMTVVRQAPALTYTNDDPPLFLMFYYPYGPGLVRKLAQPVPDYSGWPDERMVRDIDRFTNTGVDVVVVAVDADSTHEMYMQERLSRFLGLCTEHGGKLQVAFFLYRGDGKTPWSDLEEAGSQLVQWMVDPSVAYSPSYWRFEGRPALILDEAMTNLRISHPALKIVRTKGIGGEWNLSSPSAQGGCVFNKNRTQAVVYGGYFTNGSWFLPRQRGKTLKHALWTAFEARASVICIASWNNFMRGSFVEPNNLDSTELLDVLKHEIRRTRQSQLASHPN